MSISEVQTSVQYSLPLVKNARKEISKADVLPCILEASAKTSAGVAGGRLNLRRWMCKRKAKTRQLSDLCIAHCNMWSNI